MMSGREQRLTEESKRISAALDKMRHEPFRASVEYWLESGTVSGSWLEALAAMLEQERRDMIAKMATETRKGLEYLADVKHAVKRQRAEASERLFTAEQVREIQGKGDPDSDFATYHRVNLSPHEWTWTEAETLAMARELQRVHGAISGLLKQQQAEAHSEQFPGFAEFQRRGFCEPAKEIGYDKPQRQEDVQHEPPLVGQSVIFHEASDEQVRWGDDPREHLIKGHTYKIVGVDVHGWQTKVELDGFEGHWFNSVHFVAQEESQPQRQELTPEEKLLKAIEDIGGWPPFMQHHRKKALKAIAQYGQQCAKNEQEAKDNAEGHLASLCDRLNTYARPLFVTEARDYLSLGETVSLIDRVIQAERADSEKRGKGLGFAAAREMRIPGMSDDLIEKRDYKYPSVDDYKETL